MTNFEREMHRALMADAQKLRDMGVDCADPIFLTDDMEIIEAPDPLAPVFEPCAACEGRGYDPESYRRARHPDAVEACCICQGLGEVEVEALSRAPLPSTEGPANGN